MSEGNGLPDMPKKTSSTSSQGLPDMPVKKKVEEAPTNITSTSTAPSVSDGGSSGLEIGDSAPIKTAAPINFNPGQPLDKNFQQPQEQNTLQPVIKQPAAAPIDFEAGRTYRVPGKTALGNKVISYTQPSATISVDEEKNNKKIADDDATKKLVDNYENYKATAGPDEKTNAADFYLENLKKTNPDEYKYTMDKQQALSEENDPLKVQEYHADLIKKSLLLKTKVMGGKLDVVKNNINDNYKPILDDVDALTKESDGLATQINGIDNFIKQNFQVDENGQVITTPTNRKTAEDMFKKREEFINQLKEKQTKLDEHKNNQDFTDAMSQLDDIEKEYNSAAGLYKEFADKNPNAYKGLPALKKQIEEEQSVQFSKDLNEKMTGGDMGIMEATGRGATHVLKNSVFAVKDKLGDDDEYGWTDTWYDNTKGFFDKFDSEHNPLPTGYDKPMYDKETGNWNVRYMPGKLAQTVTEMALIIAASAGFGATAGLLARGAATGELPVLLGSFTGEYVTIAGDYYDQARDAGMGDREATRFASEVATKQSMISLISPDIKLLNGVKGTIDGFSKMIAKGVTKKDAMNLTMTAVKDVFKSGVNNAKKEVPQEMLQTWKEIQDLNHMYESMGLNEKVKKSIYNDMVETIGVSIIISFGFGAVGAKSKSGMMRDAHMMLASHPDILLARGQKMLDKKIITRAQFDKLSIKAAKASEALSKIDKNLSSETKAEVLPLIVEKNELKEQKQNTDDTQHAAINEKIKLKDEEIKNAMESPSKEQIAHDEFLKGFDAEITADNKKPVVEIPKSENEQQLDGLIERDDSQKSVPIELSVNPETKTEAVDETTDNRGENSTNRVFDETGMGLGRSNPNSLSTNEGSQYRITGQSQIDDIIDSGEIRSPEGKMKGGKSGEVHWASGNENLFYYDTKRFVLETKNAKHDSKGALSLNDLSAIWAFNEKTKSWDNILEDIKSKRKPKENSKTKTEAPVEKTEQEVRDEKIALLEQAKKDIKEKEYWQEKITEAQYLAREREIDKEIAALKKPLPLSEDKKTETKSEKVVEAPIVADIKKETSVKTEDVSVPDTKVAEKPTIVDKDWHDNFKKENPNTLLAIDEKNGFVSIVDEKGNSKEIAPEDFLNEVKKSIKDGYKGIAKVSRKALDSQVKENNKTKSAPLIDKASKTETVEATAEKPTEKKAEDTTSLTDEEEVDDVKDHQPTLQKMQDDLEVLKQYSPSNIKLDSKSDEEIKNLAVKKYQAMIERAYKAKLDGKISKATYTIFRNAAGDILGPKIAEKGREVKGQIDAIKEKIKEKLLGEGYKNILLSAPGINPKTIADLIDLTADLVKRGVDAGHEVRKIVEKAVDYIKNHPNYKSILEEAKVTDKEFRKQFESKIGQLESIVKEPAPTEKPAEKETEGTSQSNKETVDNKESDQKTDDKKSTESKEKTAPLNEKPDIGTGETKNMKHFDRIKDNPKYKELVASLEEGDGTQDVTSIEKTDAYAAEVVKDAEKNDMLIDLAMELTNNKDLLHNDVQEPVMIRLVEKLNLMMDQAGISEFEKSELMAISAKLHAAMMRNISNGMKKGAIAGKINKEVFSDVSASPTQTTAMVREKVKSMQDEALSDKEKNASERAGTDINAILESEEFKDIVEKAATEKIKEISKDRMGEEKSNKFFDLMKSLKVDLKDC